MGFLKIITKAGTDDGYLENCFKYVTDKHTLPGMYGGINVRPENGYNQMIAVKNYFGKNSGNQLVHFIVSFNNNVFTIEQTINMSYGIANYFKDRYQIIFGIHKASRKNNKGKTVSYFHTHFLMNSVSFVDGKKYADNRADTYRFLEHIKHVTGDRYWKVRYGANSEIDYGSIDAV